MYFIYLMYLLLMANPVGSQGMTVSQAYDYRQEYIQTNTVKDAESLADPEVKQLLEAR